MTRRSSQSSANVGVSSNDRVVSSWIERPGLSLSLLLCCALAARLLFLYSAKDDIFAWHLVIDADFYDQWARQILGGDWIGEEAFYQDPLYAYFLAACYGLFGYSLNAVRLVQTFLDLATIGFIFLIGRRLLDRRSALVAAALTAFYGPMIYYCSLLDKTTVATFLIAGSLWVFCAARASRSVRLYFLSGLAFGVASLTRGNVLLVGTALGGWTFLHEARQLEGQPFRRFGAFAGGLALVVAFVRSCDEITISS